MKKKITVVVPTFNRKEYLRVALNSLFAQTECDFAILISDNCSTDGTKDEFAYIRQPNCTYVRNQNPVSAYDNWKNALSLVETDYVCFLGDDDWLGPQFIANHHAVLAKHPEVSCSFSSFTRVDSLGDILGVVKLPMAGIVAASQFAEGALGHNPFITTCVFRISELKEAWAKTASYEFQVDFGLGFDYMLLLYLSHMPGYFHAGSHGDQVFVRLHPGSATNEYSVKMYDETFGFLLHFLAHDLNEAILSKKQVLAEISMWSIQASRGYRKTSYWQNLKWAIRALYYAPMNRHSLANGFKSILAIR